MKPYRLKVPAFGLSWYELSHVDKNIDHSLLLIPGGGGSTKSGVKNQIMIAKHFHKSVKDQLVFLDSFLTDSENITSLCTGVSHGTISGKPAICVLVDCFCILFEATIPEDTGSLSLKKKTSFQADFNAVENEPPSLNVSLVTSFGFVVTGGDDGIVRSWKISIDASSEAWEVEKVHDMKGHTSAISALSEHPSSPWVCSAAKDGSCKLWNLENGQLLVDIPFLIDIIPNFKVVNGQSPKVECRGCSFSLDGNQLYSIQSMRRGGTQLIVWNIEIKTPLVTNAADKGKEKESQELVLNAYYVKSKPIGKVPCTKLCQSLDGQYLAVGGSDGRVTVVDSDSLAEVQSFEAHDLPVTGLCFAPSVVAERLASDAVLASCSADNKLNIIYIKKGSLLKKLLIVLVFFFLLALLYLISTGLHLQLSAILYH